MRSIVAWGGSQGITSHARQGLGEFDSVALFCPKSVGSLCRGQLGAIDSPDFGSAGHLLALQSLADWIAIVWLNPAVVGFVVGADLFCPADPSDSADLAGLAGPCDLAALSDPSDFADAAVLAVPSLVPWMVSAVADPCSAEGPDSVVVLLCLADCSDRSGLATAVVDRIVCLVASASDLAFDLAADPLAAAEPCLVNHPDFVVDSCLALDLVSVPVAVGLSAVVAAAVVAVEVP